MVGQTSKKPSLEYGGVYDPTNVPAHPVGLNVFQSPQAPPPMYSSIPHPPMPEPFMGQTLKNTGSLYGQ